MPTVFPIVFIASIVAWRRLFMSFLSFGNRKKSQRAKSGKYGGIIIGLFDKNSRTSNDV